MTLWKDHFVQKVAKRMNELYVKPCGNKVILDPLTKRQVPEIGMKVASNVYWHRRLRDGDVELALPPKAKKVAD